MFDLNEHRKESNASMMISNITRNKQKTINNPSSNHTVISHSNIRNTNTQKIKEFTAKTLEIIDELERLQCISWKLKIVSSTFYDLDIEYRAQYILCSPSVRYLCKSLLMKNTKCIHNDCNDPLNSRYYLVLFQYDQKLKQQKLKKFVKTLSKKSNKYYKFSLAPMEETLKLTNFEFNCVSPVGAGNIPIIVSHHIVNGDIDHIWIGSGSLKVKLSISVREFCQRFQHFVADIT